MIAGQAADTASQSIRQAADAASRINGLFRNSVPAITVGRERMSEDYGIQLGKQTDYRHLHKSAF